MIVIHDGAFGQPRKVGHCLAAIPVQGDVVGRKSIEDNDEHVLAVGPGGGAHDAPNQGRRCRAGRQQRPELEEITPTDGVLHGDDALQVPDGNDDQCCHVKHQVEHGQQPKFIDEDRSELQAAARSADGPSRP